MMQGMALDLGKPAAIALAPPTLPGHVDSMPTFLIWRQRDSHLLRVKLIFCPLKLYMALLPPPAFFGECELEKMAFVVV